MLGFIKNKLKAFSEMLVSKEQKKIESEVILAEIPLDEKNGKIKTHPKKKTKSSEKNSEQEFVGKEIAPEFFEENFKDPETEENLEPDFDSEKLILGSKPET